MLFDLRWSGQEMSINFFCLAVSTKREKEKGKEKIQFYGSRGNTISKSRLKLTYYFHCITTSVTRLGNLLDLRQLFNAFGNN